jgi:integrase
MLERLAKRAGLPGLHPHQFRHTYAINALRSGMPERVLMLSGGWKKIPETYFRTLGAEDVARVHREISPADRLARSQPSNRDRAGVSKARGKL